MHWPKDLNKKIKTKTKLAGLTSFKIGGPAKFYFEPENYASLSRVLLTARHAGIKVFILGSGSNLLASDSGVNGLVIKLTSKDFKKINKLGNCLISGSALKLSRLIQFAKEEGLSGLEFLAGIPGTLGGALAGNAGAWGKAIGELVKDVVVLDYYGRPKKIFRKDLKFAYRSSGLSKYIIISATLGLEPGNKDLIKQKIKEYLLKRNKAQNNSFPNAGCVFKNPDKISAGYLIDRCGLKGKIIGGAAVSDKHANFILNLKQAKAVDVLALMSLIKRKVKSKFKVKLNPEIKIWR